ncbi:Rad52/Rad22 family DNA repair protein [Flavimaribacter sediminis]|nr:Rad52/Rad22 family DNA repair protein [Flavimaribacter sediminis]
MAFDQKQVRQLRSKLKQANVRSRCENGMTLHYLEGWHVISEANRIFGFDGWSRETVDVQCVYTKHNGGRYDAVYTTRIRIIVNADGARIIREGSGTGESSAQTPGQAHEFALKAAETDATKRALMTFGNAFGLSLYKSAKVDAAEMDAQFPKANDVPALHSSVGTNANDGTAEPVEQKCDVNGKAALKERNTERGGNGSVAKPLTRSKNPIDKSVLTFGEPKRIRDPEHLKFVARHRCVVCGRNGAQAHHLTFAQPHALGRKVSDEFTVPLCSKHHQELHQFGDEKAWWSKIGIEPMKIANELWRMKRQLAEARNAGRDAEVAEKLLGSKQT